MFGWVFASHQVGAAIIATVAGVVRDATGGCGPAWLLGAALCAAAALVSVSVPRAAAAA